MKTLIIGASGQMGALAMRDLVEFYDAEIVAADLNLERVRKVVESTKSKKSEAIKLDVTDAQALKKALKDVDTVLNCAWYELNMKIMPSAIEAGVHYADLGGLYFETLKQLKLDKQARDAGVTCILGIGSSPGITNLCGLAGARKLDKVESINIYCTWGTRDNIDDAAFPAYSIRTVMDELTQEPVIVENGKHKPVPPMSGEVEVVFPEPAGKVIAGYIKHSETATMAEHIGKGTKNVSFRIGFPPNDIRTFKTLVQLGFGGTKSISGVSPKDFITTMYLNAVASGRESEEMIDEYDYFRVDTIGTKDGMPARVTHYIRTWNDRERMISSGMDTATPPSIAANWLATGKIKKRGVLPPEACIEPEPFFTELGKRKILVDEELQFSSKFY
jgi:saccharopine dehydrogenase-like NADP-dependent oxidoreductase